MAGVAHLLGGGQGSTCSAQDAADEAKLLQGELGRLEPSFSLSRLLMVSPPLLLVVLRKKATGTSQADSSLASHLETAHLKKEKGEGKADVAQTNPHTMRPFRVT